MDTTAHDQRASAGESLMGRLSDKRGFALMWLLANIIGFMIGSVLGATDGGLVSQVMGAGIVPHILGDLVFGACFGFAQWLVLQRYYPQSRSRLLFWIPACMIGFMIGARLGARFAPLAGESQLLVGMAFGLLMGMSLGIVQWIAIRGLGALKTLRPGLWIPTSIIAWVAGESIAFHFRFGLAGVPLVALAIALVSGIALLWWIEPA